GGGGFLRSYRDTTLQPYLGYILPFERFYVQGFSSVSMPTDWGRDVVMMFNDLSVGWLFYRDTDGDNLVTGITPIAEVHVNTPLNHRGALTGPLGTPDSIVLTQGLTLEFRHRVHFTLAMGEPVTGFRPFDFEVVAQLNL